ncbi:DUF3159 domain-containing protein [Actinoplanes sp. NPDC051470]|uniref:DUF3159 domain-containing protein n=1 Tax=unclassified Actinoplanes TaxID=2626549 RepID=UPI003443E1FA
MTSGSEPRHVAPPDEGMDRVAEEIVEAQDLHPVSPDQAKADDEEEPLPSMSEMLSEQLGGVRGLIESGVPVAAFVLLNVILGENAAGLDKRTALYWAIGGAVGTAVLIGVYRIIRKEPIRHAINGIFGIALGAWLAWRSGEAKDFYLPGILLSLGQVVVLIASVVIRKPIIGYVWGVLVNKGRHDWFDNRELFRAFQWLTLVWAGSLFIRAGIQGWLYLADQATALGVTRVVISWPMYAATFAFTAWYIHRITRRQATEADPVSP